MSLAMESDITCKFFAELQIKSQISNNVIKYEEMTSKLAVILAISLIVNGFHFVFDGL